jgi:hypothetical protein
MRNVILTAAVVTLTFGLSARAQLMVAQNDKAKKAPVPAAAKEGDDEEGSGPTSAETGSAEVLPSKGDTVRTEGGAGAAHTVEKNDTLWDLSQKYMGSPWYWPKVWSYNPEIANPHWIYPGNVVRFMASGEEVPTEVEVGTAPAGGDDDSQYESGDDGVQVSGKIGYQPQATTTMKTTGFVTAKEIEEAGHIVGSFAEATMLSYPDTAYVQFTRKAAGKIGDGYIIFRPAGEVVHPVTGDRIGYMTHILGTAKSLRAGNATMLTLQILNTFDEVRRGDLIGPYGESLTRTITVRPNDRNLKATLVGQLTPFLTTFAEHHVVILDKGSDDGVLQGNIFVAVRQQDNTAEGVLYNPTLRDDRFPKEDVGMCMAVDVKTKATTCLIVRSIREMVVGDTMEMRAAGGNAPRASR